MNDTEKRRKKLLAQTRSLYQDDKMLPAIHPRYEAYYRQIYSNESKIYRGTFGIRCMISILAFGMYIVMGINSQMILNVSDLQVREIVMQNTPVKLY